MSTTNDQKDTVPSGDGMADKGEGSVARVTSLDPTLTESSSSDWSMVDSYGDIEDDETMSTGSSVEIVDEESECDTSNFNDSHTPVAGTSPSGRQLFILRLSTIKHISDPDTDEEKSGTVDGSQPSLHPDPVLHPQMVSEKLESLTQTLEGLKRQLSADSTAKPPVISLGPSGGTTLTDDQRSCHTSDNDNNHTLTREPASMDMQRSSIQHRDDITDSMGHDTTEPVSEPDADPAPSTNVPTLIICVLLASMSLSVYLLFTVPFVNVNNPVTPNTVHDNNEAVGRGINYRVRLNEALQEIRDLKDEVGRLKYAAPSMGMIESLLASKQDMEVELTRQGVEASVSRQQLERTVNSTMARLETVTMERDNAVRETQQLKEVIHKLEAELLSAKTGTRSKGDTKYSDDTGYTETMGSCSRDNTESSGNAGSTENCGSTKKSGLFEDTGSSSGIAACWACLHKFQDDLKQFNFDQFKDYMPTDLMESLWEFMRKSRSYYESNGYTSDWYSHFTSKESTTEENAERQSETPKAETKQDYWTSILQMINTTKHHLEDTWTKVQSTSGDILKKHEPRLHALQDTFMKKMRKLNGKIQQKMSRKWKKWFGDNEGEQEEEEEKKEKHNNRRGKAHPTPQGHDNSQHRKEKGCKRGKHNKIKKDKTPEFEQKHSNKKNDPNLFHEDNKKFQSDNGDDDSDDYFAAYDNDDDVAADWIESDDDDDNNYNMLYEDEDVRGENWYIEWAEDREYHREEPDDWFFQRQQRKNQATKKDI